MGLIDIESFMAFCKGKEGETLCTLHRPKKFKLVDVTSERLTYVPLDGTQVPRRQDRKIPLFLSRYAETGSLRPKDYEDIRSTNSSYILTLIKLYVDAKGACSHKKSE